MKVLVVEDDKKVGSFLQRALTEEGFVVDRARTSEEAFAQAKLIAYDLMVLDWMLPDGDGLTVCRQLRAAGFSTPILMLTARAEIAEKVFALNEGADDYLTKPFSLEELIARAKALVRRASASGRTTLSFGQLALDLRTRHVTLASRRLDLTSKEFVLLEFLLRHAPRIVSRTERLANVWQTTADPESNVIEVHIKNLRDKLGEIGDHLQTVRGQGYRFMNEI